jgi:hypothetical protein
MKNIIKKTVFAVMIVLPSLIMSQPQPWDPSIGGGEGGSPVGGGAPVGGGLLILLSLAIGYGARKLYDIRKKVMD